MTDHPDGRATLTQPGRAAPAAGTATKTGRHRTFPGRIALRRRANPIDIAIALVIVAVFYGIARLGRSLSVNVTPGSTPSTLPTGISHVPYYAACSLLRMFAALAISTIFTFIYGTAAARLRRAEKLLVAILDILQSVPVLGFLTFTTVFFLHLFGTAGGLEAAAVFAVFTSQAWNMPFSFYHSLKTQLDTAKSIFARQAKARAPLIRAICSNLQATSDGTLSEDSILDTLRSGFSEDRAHEQLDLAIDWGRYAELYSYDADTGQLKLDHPPSADAKARTPA